MPDPEPEAIAPARGRARRWAGRGLYVAGWCVAVTCSFLLLLAAVFWWAARHETEVAELGLGVFMPGGGIEFDELDISTPGQVVARGLRLDDAEAAVDEVIVYYSGGGWKAIEDGRIDAVEVKGGVLRLDDALLAKLMGSEDEPPPPGEEPPPSEGAPPDWLSRVIPERVSLQDIELEVAVDLVEEVPGVPRLSGTASVEIDDLPGLIAGETVAPVGPLVVRNGSWKAEGDAEPVAFDSLQLEVFVSDAFGRIEVDSAVVEGLRTDLTPEGLAEFIDAPPSDEPAGAVPEIVVRSFRAEGATLSTSGLEQLEEFAGPDIVLDLELSDLRFIDGALRSPEAQTLSLERTEIFAPGVDRATAPPLLSWDRADLRAVPDALLEGDQRRLAMLRIDGLEANVSKATLGSLLDTAPEDEGGGAKSDAPTASGEAAERPVLIIDDLAIAGATLKFDPEGLMEGIPTGKARLEMRSEGRDEDGDVRYAIELTEIEMLEDSASAKPFAQASKIVTAFRGFGLQRDGVIDSVTVSGVRAEVGEAVQRLAEAATGGASDDDLGVEVEAETEVGDAGSDLPEVTLGKLEIEDTAVTLRDVIPGALPVLTIGIDTSLENIPLSGRSRGDEREQRIEVKGVRIASQYNTLQNVAELETVWVYFTIPGLFRNEIRRVEVVGPSVYVGEPLFWFIDYIRQYAEGGDEGADGGDVEDSVPVPEPDESESLADSGDAIVEGLKGFELGGWKFGKIEAHAGKIIIAPTGTPLGIVPFPFEASTDFAKGEISLEVEVPTGDYVFENLELELRDLSGKAFVNYPVAGVDNNFVQTFKSPFVKFQQFEGKDAWVSVTYDQNGIYGQLGGNAYGGYVEGEFNLYIDGPYKWDAWVSGTDFDLGEFTDVLAPDSFKMKGVVDGKFVATGQEFNVAKATGELRTRGAGTMHVIKLDDLREALPEDWDPLWKAISNAGIDAFRDYDFSTGSADLTYEDNEGQVKIGFDGAEGARNLALRLFDRRGERAALADAPPAD